MLLLNSLLNFFINHLAAKGFCLVIAIIYYLAPVHTPYDTRFTLEVSESIYERGEFNLNLNKNEIYTHALYEYKGKTYDAFLPFSSIAALPALKLSEFFFKDRSTRFAAADKITTSVIVSLAAYSIYKMALAASLTINGSLFSMFLFSFCTTAFSVVSRSLWSHALSMLAIAKIVELLSVVHFEKKEINGILIGALLSLSYFFRPTNFVSVLIISLLVFLNYRKSFSSLVLGGFVIAGIMIAFFLTYFDMFLLPYYTHPLGINDDLLTFVFTEWIYDRLFPFEAFIGQLVSPNRGLFVSCPYLIFIFFIFWKSDLNPTLKRTVWSFVAILFFHWIVISTSTYRWWGGASFGARYFSDVLPYFFFLLLPTIKKFFEGSDKRRGLRKAGKIIFVLSIMISFMIHFRGATDMRTWEWNWSPIDLEDDLERIWSIDDIQFLRT